MSIAKMKNDPGIIQVILFYFLTSTIFSELFFTILSNKALTLWYSSGEYTTIISGDTSPE
jgi:hypothetical protein